MAAHNRVSEKLEAYRRKRRMAKRKEKGSYQKRLAARAQRRTTRGSVPPKAGTGKGT